MNGVCVRSLVIQSPNTGAPLSDGFLRTHRTGCWSTYEDTGPGTYQTLWGRGGAALLPTQPSPPEVEAARTIGQSRRFLLFVPTEGRLQWKRSSGGLHSTPKLQRSQSASEAVLFQGHFASCFSPGCQFTHPGPSGEEEMEAAQ